jgi:hypothetical protein
MALPPPIVQGRARYRGANALEPQVKDAPQESGTGVIVGCRAAPPARQMRLLMTSGMTMQHLPQEERYGGDRREDSVVPRQITYLAACGEHRVGL